jgi:hypothetical protein
MSPEENVAAVRGFIDRAWNAGDEAVFDEHIAADISSSSAGSRSTS